MKHQGTKFSIAVLLLLALALSGCGRKEAPQVINNGSITPQISDLYYEVVGNVLRLDFTLNGDANGVGYQIDRTQIDPYCKCPGFWRRFFEQPTLAKQVDVASYKIIRLTTTAEFVFRIRAIDTVGSFGPWSKLIRARAADALLN